MRRSTRQASRRRSPSSRTRSTATVQFVVEQAGRIRVVRSGTVLPTDFLDLRAAVARRRRARTARTRLRTRRVERTRSSSTSPIAPAIRSSRDSGARPIRSSPNPASRFDLRFGGRAARRSSRNRSRITTAATSPSDPTATSTSGSATAAPATIPDHRAQNPQELLGKMLRIDVNVPDAHAIGYQVPADNPFVGGRPVAARARDLGVRPAQPVALQLR